MLNVEGLCPLPHVQIPPNVKMSKMDPLDKIGNPENYLKQYVEAVKPLGLTNEQRDLDLNLNEAYDDGWGGLPLKIMTITIAFSPRSRVYIEFPLILLNRRKKKNR